MIEFLSQRIQLARQRLAFKFMPRMAEWAIWAASTSAVVELSEISPVRLLLDSTIHAHAITHESAWIDTGTKLWGGAHPVKTGYAARIPVHSADNPSAEYQDICRLTVIAGLARKGLFELHTSSELIAERERQPASRFRATGYSDYSLLDGLKIDSLDGGNFDALPMRNATTAKLQEAQRSRLQSSDDPLYRAILKALGHNKHSQDAWHIRTAHEHRMFAFLTMDYSLVRLVAAQRSKLADIGISNLVVTPSELASHFELGKVPPHLFSYTDASFPVRSDLCWPDERRRSTRKKRG